MGSMTALIWATDMLGSKTLTLGPRLAAAGDAAAGAAAGAAGASARATTALPPAATSAATTRITIRTDRRITRPLSRERSLNPTGSLSAASRRPLLQIGNRSGSG